MLTALRDAKKKGASIISINPLVETGMKKFKHPQNPIEMLGFGSSIADKHLKVKINSDQALFRAFSKSIIEYSLPLKLIFFPSLLDEATKYN